MISLLEHIAELGNWRSMILEEKLLPLGHFTTFTVLTSRLCRAKGELSKSVGYLLRQVRCLLFDTTGDDILARYPFHALEGASSVKHPWWLSFYALVPSISHLHMTDFPIPHHDVCAGMFAIDFSLAGSWPGSRQIRPISSRRGSSSCRTSLMRQKCSCTRREGSAGGRAC